MTRMGLAVFLFCSCLSAVSYVKIQSGTCESEGYDLIPTNGECFNAGLGMGYEHPMYSKSQLDIPYGCVFAPDLLPYYMKGPNKGVAWNNGDPCLAYSECTSDVPCICQDTEDPVWTKWTERDMSCSSDLSSIENGFLVDCPIFADAEAAKSACELIPECAGFTFKRSGTTQEPTGTTCFKKDCGCDHLSFDTAGEAWRLDAYRVAKPFVPPTTDMTELTDCDPLLTATDTISEIYNETICLCEEYRAVGHHVGEGFLLDDREPLTDTLQDYVELLAEAENRDGVVQDAQFLIQWNRRFKFTHQLAHNHDHNLGYAKRIWRKTCRSILVMKDRMVELAERFD